MWALFSRRPWRFAPSLLVSHTSSRAAHGQRPFLFTASTMPAELAKGRGRVGTQAGLPLNSTCHPERLADDSVPGAGLWMSLSPVTFSHPLSLLLGLNQRLPSSCGGRSGDGATAPGDDAGLWRAAIGLCFLPACQAHAGLWTESHLQSRAWPVSRCWDEGRSTHPSLGDSACGLGWEMWAQSLDFYLRAEPHHRHVPRCGKRGTRGELPPHASWVLALVQGGSFICLPLQEGRRVRGADPARGRSSLASPRTTCATGASVSVSVTRGQ